MEYFAVAHKLQPARFTRNEERAGERSNAGVSPGGGRLVNYAFRAMHGANVARLVDSPDIAALVTLSAAQRGEKNLSIFHENGLNI